MVPALQAAVGPRCSQIDLWLADNLSQSVPNICAWRFAHLRFFVTMNKRDLRCDGCGQVASPEHVARRLQRLEWTTRYRPVHIGTLLLGAVAPESDREFLYSLAGGWSGEARVLLAAAGVAFHGKSAEATLVEFQRGGFFLTHVLECPIENGEGATIRRLLAAQLPAVLTRIRRSLKPKRLAPISPELEHLLPGINSGQLNCAILLDHDKPFALDGQTVLEASERLREALTPQSVSRRQGSA